MYCDRLRRIHLLGAALSTLFVRLRGHFVRRFTVSLFLRFVRSGVRLLCEQRSGQQRQARDNQYGNGGVQAHQGFKSGGADRQSTFYLKGWICSV